MRNSRVSPLENVIITPPPSRTPPVAEPSDHTHVTSAGRAASRSSAAFRLLSGPLEGSAFTRWSPWGLPCPCRGERSGARNGSQSSLSGPVADVPPRRRLVVDTPPSTHRAIWCTFSRPEPREDRPSGVGCGRSRAVTALSRSSAQASSGARRPLLFCPFRRSAVGTSPPTSPPCTSRSRPGRRQGGSVSLWP